KRADVAAAARGDEVGHDPRERVIDHLHRLPPWPAVEETRRGWSRIKHRAGSGYDFDRTEVSLIRRLTPAREHRDRDPTGGHRRRDGAVDRPGPRVRRVREVNSDSGAVDLERDLPLNDLIVEPVVVHRPDPHVAPVGKLLEVRAHNRL